LYVTAVIISNVTYVGRAEEGNAIENGRVLEGGGNRRVAKIA